MLLSATYACERAAKLACQRNLLDELAFHFVRSRGMWDQAHACALKRQRGVRFWPWWGGQVNVIESISLAFSERARSCGCLGHGIL